MIDIRTAAQLLDFGARIGAGQRADEQLAGAVAIHNILAEQGVAYLADEVGMGKTYVALGAMALFRHFDPNFRVLVIAPRENIQTKWMKELHNFVQHNVRFADLRVKAIDGHPARSRVACHNLLELVRESILDPNRDFFVRLTSFSLPIAGDECVDPEAVRRLRSGLRESLPWLSNEVFDLRSKQAFKENFARAVCCALPLFDLVIVDEGHNLKHGLKDQSAARNHVLALSLGHPATATDLRHFPGYGPRARRVLVLSATPIEETYTHLWNQLDVLGHSTGFEALCCTDLDDERKKAIAAKFLIRRVTSIRINGTEHTKNLYRREWRRGGVYRHDEPIRIEDPRHRLVVALVQKKVSELLGHERFNASFQIGMLASFESFLETSKVKRVDEGAGNFDDSEQTKDVLEKEGLDVADVNRIARSYRERFGMEMPHPKMDAVVDSLAESWRRGEKTLVFVRRVASVKELKRKLDERYDAWLLERLHRDLPVAVHPRLQEAVAQYRTAKQQGHIDDELQGPTAPEVREVDHGGTDTFFAWFFRGEGPKGFVSGANVQQRFVQRSATYATFFEDNYVADLLGCRPGQVEEHLAGVLQKDRSELRNQLRERSKRFLTRVRQFARGDRFEAVQAAAVECLKDYPGPIQERARVIWHQRFETWLRLLHATKAPEIGNWLELPTFFTELRLRSTLRERLWPKPKSTDLLSAFRERELRGQMLASAARLGHAFIDLYTLTIRRLGSLDSGTQEASDEGSESLELERITSYLDLLERQMTTPRSERDWGAFDELAAIGAHFDLILDVNAPDANSQLLVETAASFGQLLRQQQPVGGMAGQVNQTLVRQFRMPGYPLVLISTDLLQEGEDLHTFCASIHHYGISWTPSSMEQRTGRIDRVRSQTDRTLSGLTRPLLGDDMLQVYLPHLDNSVEVLQVQKVLERMNVFLRLMHEGLTPSPSEDRRIDVRREFARGHQYVAPISERLRSAFPVEARHLRGDVEQLAVEPSLAAAIESRFRALKQSALSGLVIDWEADIRPGVMLGTARLGVRQQPFSLLLRLCERHLLLHCISPVGRVNPLETDVQNEIVTSCARHAIRIGAIATDEDHSYDLTVEGDVLLGENAVTDSLRAGLLLNRVVRHADMLEQIQLRGRDEKLEAFRNDLEAEGHHGS